MIRILFQVMLLVAVSVSAFAQKTVGTIPLDSYHIENVQGYALGDTVFVSYFETRDDMATHKEVHKAAYIYPDGTVADIFFRDVPDVSMCGLESIGGTTYYYYLERNKKHTMVKALYLDRNQALRKIIASGIDIPEQVIGTINDDGLYLVARDQQNNQLVLYEIRNMEKVHVKNSLPPGYSVLKANDFRIITPTTGWLFEAASRAKIYWRGGKLLLTVEQVNGTALYALDQNAGAPLRMVPEPSESETASFLCGQLLFRFFVDRREFWVKAFDIDSGNEIAGSQLKIKEVGAQDRIYTHSGKADKTWRHSLKNLMKYSFNAMPVIVVNEIAEGAYQVTIGTFYDLKKVGIVISPNPLVMLLGTLLWTSFNQLRDSPALSRYTYTTYLGNKFQLKKDTLTVYKLMDDFDVKKRATKVDIKDVIIKDVHGGFAIGHDRRTKTLKLIRFPD